VEDTNGIPIDLLLLQQSDEIWHLVMNLSWTEELPKELPEIDQLLFKHI
jgi:hypothetical protein